MVDASIGSILSLRLFLRPDPRVPGRCSSRGFVCLITVKRFATGAAQRAEVLSEPTLVVEARSGSTIEELTGSTDYASGASATRETGIQGHPDPLRAHPRAPRERGQGAARRRCANRLVTRCTDSPRSSSSGQR